jgi:hypothetical protein
MGNNLLKPIVYREGGHFRKCWIVGIQGNHTANEREKQGEQQWHSVTWTMEYPPNPEFGFAGRPTSN